MADITGGIQALLKVMPGAVIILTALFPRNDNMAFLPVINRINASLASMADGRRIRFLNVNNRMADAHGRLFPGVMSADQLHPALPGYQVWADGLQPILTEILGPPGREDHAPPPTGDPGASPVVR